MASPSSGAPTRASASRLRGVAPRRYACRVASNQEHGNALGLGRIAAGARRHQEIIRGRGVEHDGLLARQAPTAAAAHGGARDSRQFVAARGLVAGERHLDLSGTDPRQHRSLEPLGGGVAEQPAAHHDGAQEGLQQQAASDQFHHQHDVDGVAAETAEFFREGQRQETQVGILRPRIGGKSQRRAGQRAPPFKTVVAADETLQSFLQRELLVAVTEVHGNVKDPGSAAR